MKTKDFSFKLPDELIAQHPSPERGASRMMILDKSSGSVIHKSILDFPDLLDENTLVVLNNSRVRKARLYGVSDTGGRVEFLLLENRGRDWLAMVSKSKKQKPGKKFCFPGGINGVITGIEGPYRIICFNAPVDDSYLDINGHIPLPPYIQREDEAGDADRYQTVFSKPIGSVAAPTAGLHFTDEIIKKVENSSAGIVYVTLHVGLGTFLPVRSEHLEEHNMHRESYSVPVETAETVNRARREGKKILAVGTTSVRTLESAFKNGQLTAGDSSTDIFIYPGYSFRIVDQLLTNFHTPESSLLMLVSALAGKENIFKAYEEAVNSRYRFFSYGDAMMIR